MPSSKSIFVFAVNGLALLISTSCLGQAKPKLSPISLERTIEIDCEQTRTLNIDLGEIEIAKPYALTLRMKNTGKETFRFGKIEGNCSCMNIRVKEGEIKSGKYIDIGLDFTAPEKNPVNFLIALGFFETEKASIPFNDIHVKAKLRGVLRFGNYSRLIELEQKKISTIRVPFEISEPLRVENLEIKTSETLKDFAPQAVRQEGRAFVSLEVPESAISEDYLSGWVELKDKSSGRSDKAELLFSKFKPFRISPEISRLHEVKAESKDSKNESSGFLRIELAQNQEASEQFEKSAVDEPRVSATATINNLPIEIGLKKVSSTIYRWSLKVDDKLLENRNEGEIEWNVQINGKDFKYQTLWSKLK